MGSAIDGPRDGSTSAEGGPEPRAATRRRYFSAEHGEHGEDRTGAAPKGCPQGKVDAARPCPAIDLKISRRAFVGGGVAARVPLPPLARAVRNPVAHPGGMEGRGWELKP